MARRPVPGTSPRRRGPARKSTTVDFTTSSAEYVHVTTTLPRPGVIRHRRGARLVVGEPGGAEIATHPQPGQHPGSWRVRGHRVGPHSRGHLVQSCSPGRSDHQPRVGANRGHRATKILDDDLVRGFCRSGHAGGAADRRAHRLCPSGESPRAATRSPKNFGAFPHIDQRVTDHPLELDTLVETGIPGESARWSAYQSPAVDALHSLTPLHARVAELAGLTRPELSLVPRIGPPFVR